MLTVSHRLVLITGVDHTFAKLIESQELSEFFSERYGLFVRERFHDRSGDIRAHLAVRAGNMATLARL